jgi:hypothetical protein
MYITTGNAMTCKDCGHAIRINVICENRLQSATDMLKHMAGHNASRAFARTLPPTIEVADIVANTALPEIPLA